MFVEVRVRVVSGMSAVVAVFVVVVVVYRDHLREWPPRAALRGFETLYRLMKTLAIKVIKICIEKSL